jgi:hypothetical protein
VQVLEEGIAAQGLVVRGHAILGDEHRQSKGGKPFQDEC